MSFTLSYSRNRFLDLTFAKRGVRGWRFRSHLIELDSDQNVGASGYDVVMQRAANILICNADQQSFTKILHIHPESTLTKHLAKASNMEIVGLSDQKEGTYNYEWYYSSIERTSEPFSPSTATGLRVNSFEAVASCVPFDPAFLRDLSLDNPNPACGNHVPTLGLSSILYPLNHRGYLVVGAPSDQFARLQMKEQLLELDQQGGGSLMSFMKLLIPVQELLDERDKNEGGEVGVGVSGKDGDVAEEVSKKKAPSVMYSIACFRKG